MTRLYIPVFSLTLLLSAALLFSIQPMFSKMILPLLGGTPQVWNTAMLFFQIVLLMGYAYAHITSKFLAIRTQAILHIALLVLFFFVLPFGIPEGSLPHENENPQLWQLGIMATVIGGPFFVLSGSAPMFQRWFSGIDHPDAQNPYFLYGASNLGSMASLLAYPVLIEPNLDLAAQAYNWMIGYGALILFCVGAAALAWQAKTPTNITEDTDTQETITWSRRGFWLLCAFLPSSLMLGVTSYITTDIASVPMLWILPLALYVGTFIIVFARKDIINKNGLIWVQGALLFLLITKTLVFNNIPPLALVSLHFALFFASALLCHKELADSRPGTKHLTEFYLIMSLGGALGGVFNALLAPVIFTIPLEYPLILVAITAMRYVDDKESSFRNALRTTFTGLRNEPIDTLMAPKYIGAILMTLLIITLHETGNHNLNAEPMIAAVVFLVGITLIQTRWILAIFLVATLSFNPIGYALNGIGDIKYIHQERNFFGVLRVVDSGKDKIRVLLHGTTTHGTQPLAEDQKLMPVSYYGLRSPYAETFDYLKTRPGDQKIAVLGLGIGVMACYTHPGRSFDFYEIDPAVIELAENKDYFTYLSDCGSPYEVILGDGRLRILEKPDNYYDIIVLDAFSSDNIPVHLLTLEALKMYRTKLKENGILALHISNNFLDLEPVLTTAAQHLQLKSIAKIGPDIKTVEDSDLPLYLSHLFLMLPPEFDTAPFAKNGWSAGMRFEHSRYWTDQFSNVFSVLGKRASLARYNALVEEKKKQDALKPKSESAVKEIETPTKGE